MVATVGVISNDTDFDGLPDDDNMKAILLGSPSHGQLAWNTNGIFTYTPDPEFVGTDSFTYQDDDGHSDNHLSNVATVTLNVTPANSVPADEIIVNDESYTTKLTCLWSFHIRACWRTITARMATQSGHCMDVPQILLQPSRCISKLMDHLLTHRPPVLSGKRISATTSTMAKALPREWARLLACYREGDRPPLTPDFDADLQLLEDQPLTIQQIDLLANAIDPDGDTIRAKIVDQPAHGTLLVRPNGDFLYTRQPTTQGRTPLLTSPTMASSIAMLTPSRSKIAPVNDPPRFTAVMGLYVNDESGPQSIDAGRAIFLPAHSTNQDRIFIL